MNSFHVTSQRARLIWSIVTKLTFVRFFTSVNSDVPNWVLLFSKHFLAKRTLIKLSHVYWYSRLKNSDCICISMKQSFHFELKANSYFKGIIMSGCFLRMCLFRLEICVKVSLHWGQAYGFSPVWTKIWCSIPYKSLKTVGQNGHLYWPAPSLIGLCNARIRKESQQNLSFIEKSAVCLQLLNNTLFHEPWFVTRVN